LDATGKLAFLQLDVRDKGTDPTQLTAGFSVDVQDSNRDGKLTSAELRDVEFDTDLDLEADVNLELQASFGGDETLPSIVSDFNLDWSLVDAVTNSSQELGGTLKPTIAFNDVRLDLGSFISDFAKPILDKVKTITEPINPVLDLLTQDIKLLKFIDKEKPNLLSLATAFGSINEQDQNFIESLAQIVDIVRSIPENPDTIQIKLGSFNLGDADIRDSSLVLSEVDPNITETPDELAEQLDDAGTTANEEKEFITKLSSTPGGGLEFPILSNLKLHSACC
jgi:hypothetical protein